jgi:acyl dehydratase
VKDYYFDDFKIGDTLTTDSATVTEQDVITFANQFDPQPFHNDKAAAEKTEFGGLIASGFHMLSLSFSLFFNMRVIEKHNLGSPGMDKVRWLRPMRPGDTIHSVIEVTDMKPSASKSDRGSIWMRHDTINQNGETIMTVDCIHRLKRRPDVSQ